MVETSRAINERLATVTVLAVGAIMTFAFVYWLYAIIF